jgi:hypothetical protein
MVVAFYNYCTIGLYGDFMYNFGGAKVKNLKNTCYQYHQELKKLLQGFNEMKVQMRKRYMIVACAFIVKFVQTM